MKNHKRFQTIVGIDKGSPKGDFTARVESHMEGDIRVIDKISLY